MFRVGETGVGEMGIGETGVGETGPNRCIQRGPGFHTKKKINK